MLGFIILSILSGFFLSTDALNYDRNITSADVLSLSVTFYTNGQKAAETDTTKYIVLEQCYTSTAGKKYAQLSIISPDNPTFNSSEPYPVIELSNCKDVWNASCVFATNYIWDIQSPIIYSNITWIYGTESDYIYVRYRSYSRDIPISLLLSYTDYASPVLGEYSAGVINGNTASNADYESLLQYVKSSHTSSVQTNDHQVFFFSFCTEDWIGTGDYSLTATVVSDILSPLSAFDIVGCAYSQFPNPQDCTLSNIYAISNQDAAPLVYITMHNNEKNDLTQGVYLSVYGEGGNADLSNVFLIDITIAVEQ